MTISVLDRTDGTAEASLGQLHDDTQAESTRRSCRAGSTTRSCGSPNRPPTWSSPRRCAWTARSASCASTVLSNGVSPGASGAGSSSCRAW